MSMVRLQVSLVMVIYNIGAIAVIRRSPHERPFVELCSNNRDGFGIGSGSATVEDVIFDHCSAVSAQVICSTRQSMTCDRTRESSNIAICNLHRFHSDLGYGRERQLVVRFCLILRDTYSLNHDNCAHINMMSCSTFHHLQIKGTPQGRLGIAVAVAISSHARSNDGNRRFLYPSQPYDHQ